jgi:glycosyltransferase involved in cell wall biosynthesis
VPIEALGAGQYVVELVRAADKLDVLALTLFARRDDAQRWREVAPRAEVLPLAPSGRAARVAWEGLGLTAAARRRTGPVRLRVLHGPHYSLPPWTGLPGVVTVHDLTFVDHPEWHERSKAVYFRRALAVAARRAAVVVCVSQRTAARFAELYPTSAPVVVVGHGVDHGRFTTVEQSAGADTAVLERLGVREPYVLHTGTIQPRKDLATLVAAFDRIAGGRRELHLVLAGGAGWATSALDAAVASSPYRARILRLGHVDDGDVASLVRRAGVAAYPSLEEGFGLPALEELDCGTPHVTTEYSTM